jgi:hypothetical protein
MERNEKIDRPPVSQSFGRMRLLGSFKSVKPIGRLAATF